MLALVLLGALAMLLVAQPQALQPTRTLVFDGYQRLFPLERTSAPVAIVAIDEPSLAQFGQWPWPRTRLAALVERIAAAQPAAIGLDLFFPEADRFSPERLATEIAEVPPAFSQWLALRPSSDARFAQALTRAPVVVGIAAGEPESRFASPPVAAPVRTFGPSRLTSYAGYVGNLPAIDRAAASRGLMNSGPIDQVVRQVPLVASVQGVIVPSLGVEALRVATGGFLTLREEPGGLLRMSFGDVSTVMQDDGTAWVRFGPHDPERFVSALDVIEGKADEQLRQKVVLVGIYGLGLLDFRSTPLGEFVPGVEIHAQVVENLYNGVGLNRPAYAPRLEAMALLVCGVILIVFIPRLSALEGAHLVAGLVVLLGGAGLIAFRNFGLLYDPLSPALGTMAVFVSVVVGSLSEAERQRRQLRDQAARMAGEVDAARRIQMGLLPNPRETVGADRRFQVAAFLEPARTVGGDFYDCFWVDGNRLFFVVADVSGKGLPAALFMASVKSHLKSAALRGGLVGDVLSAAQHEVERENPEQLFVTAFAGILDARTGELEFANAGHEPPFTRTPNGAPERLAGAGGPPICVIEGFAYPTSQRTLAPGEWLFVVTDGATEAMNPEREFFGAERLRTSLGWVPADADPEEMIRRVRDDVRRFARGAEAPDDLTLLALRYGGR